MHDHLPPGVTTGDLPGNRPFDIFFDDVMQRVHSPIVDKWDESEENRKVIEAIIHSRYEKGMSREEVSEILNQKYENGEL